MRITSRGFAAVTAGLVSAVVLAGCSSNSTKPTVLPSLQTTPATATSAATSAAPPPAATSGAPTPSSAAPVAPTPKVSATVPATKDTLATTTRDIESATRAYFAITNKAIGDGKALADMKNSFSASCQQCTTDLSNIAKIHAGQKKVTGGGYKVIRIVAQATNANSGASTVTFSTIADTIYDKTGKVLERDPAQPEQSAGITLSRLGSRWIVIGWINFGEIK